MKKILVLAFTVASFSAIAAPTYQQYVTQITSHTYLERVAIIAKRVSVGIIQAQPTPSTPLEVKRYNFAHDILAAKTNSKLIYTIASYVTSDLFLTNLNDSYQTDNDIETAITNEFDRIGKIY